MSYDLFFKPRTGNIKPMDIIDYFRQRRDYQVDSQQAFYQNEDTGVYFVFELQSETGPDEDRPYPVTLNINYFRPSFFGIEAEQEVTALVRTFDMTVFDPQENGMGEGEYSPEGFLRGWNHGNEFGYSAFLAEPNHRVNLIYFPTKNLIDAWTWNRSRSELQREFGEWKFVPKINFVLLDGQPSTAAVWPDGIPIAVPEVDYFLVMRKQMAPRRLFRRIEDMTLLSRDDALPIFEKHRSSRGDGIVVLSYDRPPQEVKKFVESLPRDGRKIQVVSADKVLNQELVEKFWTANSLS